MALEVRIVSREAEKLVGMQIRTSMEKATTDCPKLWKVFGPRIKEINTGGKCYSCGVSLASDNPDSMDFEYWAAMPLGAGAAIPEGMATLDLEAGLYAEFKVPSLADLGDAYNYIYFEWMKSQQEYTINMAGISCEHYTPNYQDSEPILIYVTIDKA